METVFAFLRAALPWIAVGLLLALLCARRAGKKQKEKPSGDYGTEGMCLGMCLGTAIGSSLGNNTGIGISLGMLLGLAVGTCMQKEQDGEGDEGDDET